MAAALEGHMWGRQSLRKKASREACDDWSFDAGQKITLLAFNLKTADGEAWGD